MQSIFGTDGIRGRFNEEITYSLAYKVGYALGSTLEKKNPILIGRDTRISGDILLQAITQGINESGKKFINLGICPTPAIPFLIKEVNLSSGIMISAKSEGTLEREKIISTAHDEAQQELTKLRENLRKEVAGLAISGAEKILTREINTADHKEMLDKLANKL